MTALTNAITSEKFLPCGRHPQMHRCVRNKMKQIRALCSELKQFEARQKCEFVLIISDKIGDLAKDSWQRYQTTRSMRLQLSLAAKLSLQSQIIRRIGIVWWTLRCRFGPDGDEVRVSA